jgi:D-alanine-D-alanine ligase
MKTIAVIFGGRSTEHDVSIVTALASIIKPLELTGKFNVVPVYITKEGVWLSDEKLKDIDIYRTGKIDQLTKKLPKIHLTFQDGLGFVKHSQFTGKKTHTRIDMVFPAMHGTHGENGELMGILEMANVAYVGCDLPSSAVAMDKVLSKQVTDSAGIYSTPWTWFYSYDFAKSRTSIIEKINRLKYPLFVKPAHLGSSIGITKVNSKLDLENALEVAVHYDNKVIVEQAVENLIEVTLPIMGNHMPQVALLEQPVVKDENFFDFDTKYLGNGKKGSKGLKSTESGAQGYSIIPAKLSNKLYDKAVSLALDVYRTVGCVGIARIDMLINSKTQQVFFNEINPLPGSLYSHNWNKAGVSNIELVTKLVDFGFDAWQEKQKMVTSFSTNYLKNF